ncbi:MAG TPA: Cof-type HAD-IIB family hydrolase [Anaerolineales bacterium]
MIKLFAIDLDGTMYTTGRSITQPVRAALLRALENGIQPVIVTGRGHRGAEIALDTLGMDFPYICSAGALLRSGLGGETIHAWTFHEHHQLLHIIAFTRQHGTGLIAEPADGSSYWFGPDSMREILDPLTAREASGAIRTFDPEQDYDRPMLKVTVTAGPALLAEAEKLIRAKCPSIHQVYSGIQYIDLTADGVNKGSALSALAESRGLQPCEVAAIGDQAIDLQMLKYAGLPIAMFNAVPALKGAAQWLAPSNDEDGVAWAIDEILKYNAAA